MFRFASCITAAALLVWALLPLAASAEEKHDPSLLDEQRRVFIEVWPRAELGDWRPAASNEQLLKSYALWPDLRAAWLRTRIRNQDFSEVEPFLDHYGTLKPARDLRYRYALELGQGGRLDAYHRVYQQFYQGLGVPRLDCLGLQAEISNGREQRIVNRGVELWLVGRNQVDECDPVFANLKKQRVLDVGLYQQRYDLAIGERQFGMARYLSRALPGNYQQAVRNWQAVVNDPAAFLANRDQADDSETYREQILYAIERLAYRQPALAHEWWLQVSPDYTFSGTQTSATERHIGLWAARRHLPQASGLLNDLPADAIDAEVRRWRVRALLLAGDWKGVVAAVQEMPANQQDAEEWRYWLAYAQLQSGERDAARAGWTRLATERSYFGFLAADRVEKDYALLHEPVVADEAVIAELETRSDIIRARELFFVGQESRGRSEWDTAIALLSEHQKLQASILAHRWGWHSRAIATAASAGKYDDLELRYPLPWRPEFERHAEAASVPQSWAYGIARSESLFMRDVRSSAGAIGVMQLMPATGRSTASKISEPYSGLVTLTNPDSNIRLGTAYLRMMLDRFGDNPVLATAAYNAGPENVSQWLPESGVVDPQIWIENIPYNETRKYVRRVLTTDTIFDWRLTGQWQRLTPQMPAISAPVQVAETQQ